MTGLCATAAALALHVAGLHPVPALSRDYVAHRCRTHDSFSARFGHWRPVRVTITGWAAATVK